MDKDEFNKESIHYDDSLPKTKEVNNPDSKINEQGKSFTYTKIPEVQNASDELKAKVHTPKAKANILPVVLISAAVSGSTVIGVTQVVTKPSFNVSLFSKTMTSLTFEVGVNNLNPEDEVFAELSINDDIVGSQGLFESKFISFYNLEASTIYDLKIYLNDTAAYSRSFITSSVEYGSAGLEVMDYNEDMLAFTIYNDMTYPFITTKVYTEKGLVLLNKDSSEEETFYQIFNFPLDQFIYITVKYKDIGLSYFELPPLVVEESEETTEEESEITSENESESESEFDSEYESESETESESLPSFALEVEEESVSYNFIILNFSFVNYEYFNGIHLFANSEEIEGEVGESNAVYSISDLHPEESVSIEVNDDDGNILFEETYQTSSVVDLTQEGSAIQITFAKEFYNNIISDQNRWSFEVVDGLQNPIFQGDIEETISNFDSDELYSEDVTLIIYEPYLAGDDVTGQSVEYRIYTSKVFTLTGLERLNVEISVSSEYILSINYVSGYIPEMLYMDIVKQNGDYDASGIVVTLNVDGSGPTEIDLSTGSYPGDVYASNHYDVTPGTYNLTMLGGDFAVFRTSFVIE